MTTKRIVILGIPQSSPIQTNLNREIPRRNLRLRRGLTASHRSLITTAPLSRLRHRGPKASTKLARKFIRLLFFLHGADFLNATADAGDEDGGVADAGGVHVAFDWEGGDAGLL